MHATALLEQHLWQYYPMSTVAWLGVDGEPQMMGGHMGLRGRLTRRNVYMTTNHCVNHCQMLGHTKAKKQVEESQKEFGQVLDSVNKYLKRDPGAEAKCMKLSKDRRNSKRIKTQG